MAKFSEAAAYLANLANHMLLPTLLPDWLSTIFYPQTVILGEIHAGQVPLLVPNPYGGLKDGTDILAQSDR
ncbi:hypothetical protein [Pseudogulbenkiania subflava]|nr:hypothetical protein [Pseudogulbenkiania subflava]